MTQHQATVLVADAKPLSLLATAGVLHHAGMQCICARDADAVRKALASPSSLPDPTQSSVKSPIEQPAEAQPRFDEAQEPIQPAAPSTTTIDLLIWDVGDDAASTLETVEAIRGQSPYHELPVIYLADSKWAGLEKRVEKETVATRCLFQPIDPGSLVAVAEQLLWMPSLQSAHRVRGSRPSRPGWVTLD